jgi:hypothetical protein
LSETPLIVLGEVRTSLLPSAAALTRDEVDELLSLVPGRMVRWRERPVGLGTSPAKAIGVDCRLPTGSSLEIRVVGTVAVMSVVVGGWIMQSSAVTRVMRVPPRRRQPWSHYLKRIGVTEASMEAEREDVIEDLIDGFLAGPDPSDKTLDLGSITARALDELRERCRPGRAGPVRTTRLRWIARVGGGPGPKADMRLEDDQVRSIRLIARDDEDLVAAQRFCEDVAAHDWLLTSSADVIAAADRAVAVGLAQSDVLSPMLAHRTHLWMPGAHTPPRLRTLWKHFQNDPGFSRQWTATVDQMRDRVKVETLQMLEAIKTTLAQR